MNISYKVIGNNIRAARNAANLTQEEVAERINMSLLHYGRAERGTRCIPLHQLTRIAEELHVSVETLLRGCIFDEQKYAAVFEASAGEPDGFAEYVLVLLDMYRDQIKSYYEYLKKEEKSSS